MKFPLRLFALRHDKICTLTHDDDAQEAAANAAAGRESIQLPRPYTPSIPPRKLVVIGCDCCATLIYEVQGRNER